MKPSFVFRNIIITLSIFCFLVVSNLNSQTDDFVFEVGKKYKVVLFNDTEIIGKVTEVGKDYIKVKQDISIITILKDNILYVTGDLTPSKYKYSFSLLGGVSMLTDDYYYYRSDNRAPVGLNASLTSMFYIADNKAIKIDFGYSFIKAKYDQVYPLYYGYLPSSYTGGDISYFSLKPNIVLGSMNPQNRVIAYGSLGLGIHITHYSERTESGYYYDTTYRTYTYPARTITNAVFSLGGGLAYRISKNFGVHAEIEYNYITDGGLFFLFGGRGYFPIRAGITYTIF